MLLKTPVFTTRLLGGRGNIVVFVGRFLSGSSCVPNAKLSMLVYEGVMR